MIIRHYLADNWLRLTPIKTNAYKFTKSTTTNPHESTRIDTNSRESTQIHDNTTKPLRHFEAILIHITQKVRFCPKGPQYMIFVQRGPNIWFKFKGAPIYDFCPKGPQYMIYVQRGPNIWFLSKGAPIYDLCPKGPQYMIFVQRGPNIWFKSKGAPIYDLFPKGPQYMK